MMKAFIITGTSRGLGEAIAEKLLAPNDHFVCISRTKNEQLLSKAMKSKASLDYYEYDLNDIHHIDTLMSNIFSKLPTDSLEGLYLINNAGIVKPIGPVQKNTSEEITLNIHVNLIAPMIMTANFIKHSASLKIDKRILNISSGAGRKSYNGWSSYCSAKAGLDHFTRCVAAEQSDKEYGVKLVSIAPGIIDTNMQVDIRSSNKDDFALLQKFIEYKETDQLLQPDYVAEKLINLLFNQHFGKNEQIIDIRTYNGA
ncbi:(S)-benzoin forming benzil reductase [Bacillus aquiflavi]|uniref:(S)-benzoin forming benzil reductase n=1 Tax=Bacillus aquiflavi TaxID=2672567 RepID=A0A6B3VXU5_9BACI|nr:(S)-benzoin forming benzil reductase [Bacillus aquiflavi]MBA4537862.1 (S)-benzoin forming benzil reductase [Bacillus aquiflavi]NEY82118.1 (S)-benzoin forming benzil reductase [Bacillus aquiflavi]UAC48437.1 (S)-benzoin forming benzil reductase [Bacillus aquiflavi]